MTKTTDDPPRPFRFRIRMISLRWHVIVVDAKGFTVQDECLGPFKGITDAEEAAKATGYSDWDRDGAAARRD